VAAKEALEARDDQKMSSPPRTNATRAPRTLMGTTKVKKRRELKVSMLRNLKLKCALLTP
jgi:hypothetical protein